MKTEKQLYESINNGVPATNKDRGLDSGIWDDPEIWLTLMKKMRDADSDLYYAAGANGWVRLAFTNEHFSEYVGTTSFLGMAMPAIRPIEEKIPDKIKVNSIDFEKWEILAIIRAANPNVWYATE